MSKCGVSCFDCKFSQFVKGSPQTYWEPGEPDMAECHHPHIDFDSDENIKMFENNTEDTLPARCGKFEPILIERCSCRACNKVMNVPRWSHNIWATTYDEPVPVCGESCKDAVEVECRMIDEVGY